MGSAGSGCSCVFGMLNRVGRAAGSVFRGPPTLPAFSCTMRGTFSEPFRCVLMRVDPHGCGALRDYAFFGARRFVLVPDALPDVFPTPFHRFSSSAAMPLRKLLRKKAVRTALRQALTQSTAAAAGTTAAGGSLTSILTALATGAAGTAGVAGVANLTGLHMTDVGAMVDTVLAHASRIDFAALSGHVADGARTAADFGGDALAFVKARMPEWATLENAAKFARELFDTLRHAAGEGLEKLGTFIKS